MLIALVVMSNMIAFVLHITYYDGKGISVFLSFMNEGSLPLRLLFTLGVDVIILVCQVLLVNMKHGIMQLQSESGSSSDDGESTQAEAEAAVVNDGDISSEDREPLHSQVLV